MASRIQFNDFQKKSLEALKDMAEGKATKIIVPSDLQGLAGLATSLKEIMTDKNIEKK